LWPWEDSSERGDRVNGIFHHIGLFSQYPEELVEFYTGKLGFERIDSKTISKEWMTRIFGLPEMTQMIKLRAGPLVIEVFSSPKIRTEGHGTRFAGYNHWGLGVVNKEAFVQELERKGVPVLKLEGKGRFVYFIKDPEDNLIEIYQR
jgi:catechol 2,3-dioxygenase-like lactoylglutathione lyase family enzyme